jgi:hypothetical protein
MHICDDAMFWLNHVVIDIEFEMSVQKTKALFMILTKMYL